MKYNSLKSYTKDLFDIAATVDNMNENVNLKIINLPLYPVGSLKYDKNLTTATVKINLYPLMQKKEDKNKIYFDITSTLFHELEHTKTFLKTTEYNFYNFEHIISLMEFLYYANIFNISYDEPSISSYKLLKIKKQTDKNYDISTSEINADLIGYSTAFETFKDKLDASSAKICKDAINVLNLLNSNIEIYYDYLGCCVNKFSLFFENTCKYVRKNPKILNKYKILQNLFKNDGTPKNIKEIYESMNIENEKMYKKIITFYIISTEIDYNEYFKDDNFKQFIEVLIDEYISNTIKYFKNIDMCKLFIENKKMLTDNLLLKKKNVMVLNKIINKYSLSIKNGTIIDNSNIGNQKRLHNF